MLTGSKAVIDLGFGDSGKGTFTAYLCSQSKNPIVVRFCGGHQAGHTVVNEDGLRHVFSSFGSGSMIDVPTYWSEHCTFHPTAFLNELSVLKNKGITPKIYVNGKCPITTVGDVHFNRKKEITNLHGSCGVGFGATLEREEQFYSLLVEDLLFPSVFVKKMEMIVKYYKDKKVSLYGWASFLKDCEEVVSRIEIVYGVPPQYNSIIYEGAQGLLLDKNIGFFPHVTRSNTGLHNIFRGIDWEIPNEVFYVTRAYQTRHGNGPMTNENLVHNIKENPNETNTSDVFQGKFRRALLDVDLLRYALYKDAKDITDGNSVVKSLVITCLDHVEEGLSFTSKGKLISCSSIDAFVWKVSDELNITKVYTSKSEKFSRIQRFR